MDQNKHKILYEDSQIGPYPLDKLPRVDKITTKIIDDTIRVSQRETALARCMRGDFGEYVKERGKHLSSRYPMCEALFSTLPYIAKMPLNPVAEEKAPLTDDIDLMTRHIKRYTYFLGADQVGICKIPPRTIYLEDQDFQPYENEYTYAIVFLNKKESATVAASYGNEWADDSSSWTVYQQGAMISQTLSRYIRSLGYPARASHITNYVTLMPRLIAEAGLGEFSRMGIVVNPFFGAQFKAACVLTNLPLNCDKPIDFGLQDYCSKCTICADQCMTGSIPKGGKTVHNGYESWILDREKCAKFCVTNPHGDFCQRCTKVCPFNRPDESPDQFKDWDGNLDYLYELVNKQRKHLEECNFIEPEEADRKWWLPLAEVDGKVVEMPEFDYKFHEARHGKNKTTR